jgi:hypothetical protein
LTDIPPSYLAQRYLFGVIQTSLQLTFTVSSDPDRDFSNRTGIFLQSVVHLTDFFPSSLALRYGSRLIQTSLQLTVTVKFDPGLEFLKQNWIMSAEWSTFDSLHPFLSCTEICVRGNTDISAINSYVYI